MKIRVSEPIPACDLEITLLDNNAQGEWVLRYRLSDKPDQSFISPILAAGGHRRMRWREGKPTGRQVIASAERVLGRALTPAESTELLDTIKIGGQHTVETGDDQL